ncbi:MAG: hypothetical protein ABII90_13430 [Bacteroidota bacterium]
MKNLKTYLLLSLISPLLSFNQPLFSQSASDIFSSSEIVWCGLDYSHVKLVGSIGFIDPYEIKNKFLQKPFF